MNVKIAIACCVSMVVASSAYGQAVQLPTFRFFSVQTTVSVPDSGRAYLGGVNRASSGRTSRGVPGLSGLPGLNRLTNNTGIGQSRSATSAHVTATIIDNSELDRQVRAQAQSHRPPAGQQEILALRRAGHLAEHVARHDSQVPTTSSQQQVDPTNTTLKELVAKREAAAANRLARAMADIEKGKQAERDDKPGVARIFYARAAKVSTGNIKQQLLDRIAFLKRPKPTETSEQVAAN